MDARISLVGSDLTELESLRDWLCHEQALAGRVKFTGSTPRDNELGVAAQALLVAVGSGGAVSVLIGSLKAWVSLPRRSDVRIRVQGVDGRVAEITADRVSEERVDALVRQVLGITTPEE
jgi:hypothetical protein